MLDSPWLDIAIGVVLVWFICSLTVSALNELVNRLLAIRSKQLWAALNQMLDGEVRLSPPWRQFLKVPFFRERPKNSKFWADVERLTQDLSRAEADAIASSGQQDAVQDARDALAQAERTLAATDVLTAPEAVAIAHRAVDDARAHLSEAIAAAFDAVDGERKNAVESLRRDLQELQRTPFYHRLYATATLQALEDRSSPDRKTKIHNIPGKLFSQALIEMGVREPCAPEMELNTYLQTLPPQLSAQLRAIWSSSHDDIVEFRKGVEEWFDEQMARLSAFYRAQVRIVMLFFGAFVALAGFGLGARTDSLALVSDLQRDETLRTGLRDLASQVTEDDLAAIAEAGCPTDTATTTTTVPDAPATTSTTPTYVCVARGLGSYQDIDLIFDDRGSVSGGDDRDVDQWWSDFVDRLQDLGSWRRLLGVAITAAALSFGASFWWNVLRRLVGLRQNGQTAPSA